MDMHCFVQSGPISTLAGTKRPAPVCFARLGSAGFGRKSLNWRQVARKRVVQPWPLSRGASPRTPVSMADEPSNVSMATRIGAVVSLVGLIFVSFLPLLGQFQKSSPKSTASLVDAQLSRVPVFTVTDESGHPFMSESDDHRLRRGYFFIQPSDAAKYLERVRNEDADAKVLAIGLNEASKFLDNKSTPAKQIPESFQLFPDQHESELAREVTDGKFEQVFGPDGVPLFYIDGLGIKNESEGATMIPLFFEKEKLDETVASLKNTDPQASVNLEDLQVIDLKQTIKEIRAGGNTKFNRVVFVPMTQSIQAMNGRSKGQ